MAAFDFPSSPSVNQTYTANGVTWKWNGTMWMRVSGAGYLEKIEEGNSKVEVDDSGSGNVTVTTDGTERLRIESNGYVKTNSEFWVGGAGPVLRWRNGSTEYATARIASNDLYFEVAGTEKLRITSTGVVGINKSSPSSHAQLDIVGSSYWPILVKTTSTTGGGIAIKNKDDVTSLYVGSGGSSWLTGSPITDGLIRAQNNLLFGTDGNNERLRIDTNGHVGIDCTPNDHNNFSRALDVNGPSGAAVYMRTNDSTSNVFIVGNYGSDAYLNNRSNGNLRFYTSSTERLRLDNNGRLLLGLNSSIGGNAIFQVQGSGNKKAQFHQPDSGNCHIQFTNTQTGTSSNNGVEIGLGGDEQAQIWNYYNSYFRIATNNTERLRIYNDGNIRIGDSSINLAAVGSGPTLGINGSAPEITLRDSASGNPYAVMRTNDFGSLTLEADAGNNAANSTIHFRVDAAERMRINSSYLLHGDTASDLSGTHATMFCGSNHAFQHDGNSGTYLTIAVGAANGTVDLEADARSGGYPDMRFITTNSERVRIRANGDMTMRGTNSQYVEAAAFEITAASKNAIVSNNQGFVSFQSLRNSNSTIISHSSSTNPSRITFPVAGSVHFSMYQDIITAGSTGYTQARLYKNGVADRYALITLTNSQWDSIMMNTVVEVAANDYLEVYYTGGTITAMDNASWLSYNFIFYPINTNRG